MRPKLEDKALLLAKCFYCIFYLVKVVVNEEEVRLVGKSYNRLLKNGCVYPLVVLDSKIAPNPVHTLFCLIFTEFTYQDYFWYIVSVTFLPAEYLIKLLLSACDILTTIPITRVNLMLFFLKIGLNIVPSDVENALSEMGKKDETLFTFDDFLHIYETNEELFLQLKLLKDSFINNIFGILIYKHIQIRLKNIKYIFHYNEQYNSFPSDPCMWKISSFLLHKPPINKYDYSISTTTKRIKTLDNLISYFTSLYRKTQSFGKSNNNNNNRYQMHKTSIEYIHNGKIIHKRCSSCDLDYYNNNDLNNNNNILTKNVFYNRRPKNASVPRCNRSITTTSSPLFKANNNNNNGIGSDSYVNEGLTVSPTFANCDGVKFSQGFNTLLPTTSSTPTFNNNNNNNNNNMHSPRRRSSFHNDQVDVNEIMIPGLIE